MVELNLATVRERLEAAHPEEILRWTKDRFHPSVAMSSSFQTQSVPLLHLVSNAYPALPIIFLETGYHFPQTLSFRDQLVEEWNLNLREMRGDKERERAAQDGPQPLYKTDPDTCCHINKVRPMNRALQDYDAWVSGIRRDQSPERADIEIVETTDDGMIRIHPMANWTDDDVQAYIQEHELPEHPLTSEGYESIGCWPCTKRPEGDDARSGRWAGTDKTECGLHTDLRDGETD